MGDLSVSHRDLLLSVSNIPLKSQDLLFREKLLSRFVEFVQGCFTQPWLVRLKRSQDFIQQTHLEARSQEDFLRGQGVLL
jgi:hypothetical protein